MAAGGALVGLVARLAFIVKGSSGQDSYLLEAALLGAGVGAVLGFIFSDSDWLDLIGGR